MGCLDNKIALITGATRGLGLEIAKRFAWEGASVALVGRDACALEEVQHQTRSELRNARQRVLTYPTDLAKQEQLDDLIRSCLRDSERIDVLVNNAAVQGPIGPFEQNNWPAWKAVFDVNLFAPARLAQLLIPHMRKHGGGKIINLSGGGAAGSRPHFTAYGASKCALVRWTETLAEELKDDGIDVNAVAPGAMKTRMLEELISAGREAAPREYDAAIARSKAHDSAIAKAAALVAWLASSESDGITGKLISAVWDDWQHLGEHREELRMSERFTLRRVT